MVSCKTNLYKYEFLATKEGGGLFSVNRIVGGMYGRWIWRELVEEMTDKGMDQKEKRKRNAQSGGRIASGEHSRLQRNVQHEQWNIWGNIDRYRACDYQNSWPKSITNYHTRGQTRKTNIDYYEEFEQAQTEW